MSEPHSEKFDPQAFSEMAESLLLGGPRLLSPLGLAERAGVPHEAAKRLWQSMGLASVDETAIALTEYDLEATQRVQRAIELGVGDFGEIVSLSRLAGQVFAQLAETEGEAMLAMALKQSGDATFTETLERLADEILPFVEELHTYVWKRQLAAFVARKASQFSKQASLTTGATVGFADISGYTALSRRIGTEELAALLESFESIATDAVGAHNGRVVKLVGDAVLYTADEAPAGVQIALDLLDAWPQDQPPIRAGVATGPVLRRLGDVFGPTVNIASRLTSLGEPGDLLVDDTTRATVAEVPGFEFDEQQPQEVRGYDELQSWKLVRR